MYSCFDNFMKFPNVFLYIFEKEKKTHLFLEHLVNEKERIKRKDMTVPWYCGREGSI